MPKIEVKTVIQVKIKFCSAFSRSQRDLCAQTNVNFMAPVLDGNSKHV